MSWERTLVKRTFFGSAQDTHEKEVCKSSPDTFLVLRYFDEKVNLVDRKVFAEAKEGVII